MPFVLATERIVPLPDCKYRQGNRSVYRLSADCSSALCDTALDSASAVVPICRYVLRLPPAVSGRADSNHLAIHTKARFSRYKCTCPFCNPPIMIDFTHNPIIPADYKSRGRGLPYEASPFGGIFISKTSIFIKV